MINNIIIAAALATFFWRAAAAILARRLVPDSAVFNYAAGVAYAVVGALIFKLIVYPQGAAADSTLVYRLLAIALTLAVYRLSRRNIALAAWSGAAGLFLLNRW